MGKQWSHRKGAAERRDERATKAPEPEQSPGQHRASVPSKKDLRRWCRGKVGVEHQLKVYPYAWPVTPGLGSDWKILACAECGKRMKYHYPVGRHAPPAWVNEYPHADVNAKGPSAGGGRTV